MVGAERDAASPPVHAKSGRGAAFATVHDDGRPMTLAGKRSAQRALDTFGLLQRRHHKWRCVRGWQRCIRNYTMARHLISVAKVDAFTE